MSTRHPDPTAVVEPVPGFRERFTRLLRRSAPGAFSACGFTECRGGRWAFAGVALEAGDRATALAAWPGIGNAEHEFPVQLSMRVGPQSIAAHGTQHTLSIVAPRGGPLEVAINATEEHPEALPMTVVVAAVVWRASALRGLRYLASAGDVDGLVRDEIQRLCNPAGTRMTSRRSPIRWTREPAGVR
jgi:hypothetical protein